MSYRVFGETAPGFLIPDSIFQVDPSPGYQAFDNFESILTIFFNEYEANSESINAVQKLVGRRLNPIPFHVFYSPFSHLRRCRINDELGNYAKRTTEFTIQRASMDFAVGHVRGFFRDVLDFATNLEL